MGRRIRWRPGVERKADVGFWPGMAAAGLLGLAAISASWLLHLNTNWEDALTLTAVLFACLVLALRPAWHRWQLWKDLAVALVVHLFLVSLAVKLLTANGRTMGGPIRTLVVLGWGTILLAILWRRNVWLRTSRHLSRSTDESA